MRSREIAELVKRSVTMRQVVEFYGFHPDRAGYIQCPFHAGDRTASLKIYPGQGGFCCFGCGAKGSVIDFVMLLFDERFADACRRLNDDFGFNIAFGRKRSYREQKAASASFLARGEQMRIHQERALEVDRAYWAAFDLWRVADMMIDHYAPDQVGGDILSGYAAAVRDLPLLAYNLTQAEIERWKFEQTSGCAGLEQRDLPDSGTI